MEIRDTGEMRHVTIHPGEYFAFGGNVIISTLLGSCVAACLYDPATRIVGMNHFLLSNKRYTRSMQICLSEAGRYGVHAMELLINDMLKLGAKKANLRAKAFGGSSLWTFLKRPDNFLCVGEVNCRFITEFLRKDGIPLAASDLGGDRGRVIRFSSLDYSVLLRRIGKPGAPDLAKDERKYWLKLMNQQQKKTTEPEIWE